MPDYGHDLPTQPNPSVPTPTPDDGVRLTGPLAWDEATRPSAGDGGLRGFDAEQLLHPRHLLDVHNALRSELDQVRSVVEQVRQGQLGIGRARSVINTMALRQNNWTLGAFCESYCRIVTGHHALEDASVFPHLRGGSPALDAVLHRLQDEHEVIAAVLEGLDKALVALVAADPSDAAAALDRLQGEVDLLTDTLLSHLAYEERELFAPLAEHGLG